MDSGEPLLKVEYEGSAGQVVGIFNGPKDTGQVHVGGNWYKFSDIPQYSYDSQWEEYYGKFENYTSMLGEGWSEGEYEITSEDGERSWRYYNIQVNPSIPDSEFEP